MPGCGGFEQSAYLGAISYIVVDFVKRSRKGSAALKQYRGNWAGALTGGHRWAGPVAPWIYCLGSDQRRPADG